jgi:hypothetical protein
MQKIILLTLLDGVDTYARSLSDTDRELAVELGEMLVHVGVEPGSDQFHDTVSVRGDNCRSKAETVEFICAWLIRPRSPMLTKSSKWRTRLSKILYQPMSAHSSSQQKLRQCILIKSIGSPRLGSPVGPFKKKKTKSETMKVDELITSP